MTNVTPDLCPICNEEFCDHSPDAQAEHNRNMSSGQPETVVSSDPVVVEKAARADKAKGKTAKSDLTWIMSDARGRRFMWAMLGRCGVYQSSFARARGDHAGMSFFEGERNVGLELMLRCIQENPALYATMVKENGG